MKKLLFLLTAVMMWGISHADSPLTSTDFAAAYADHPMVMMAKNIADPPDTEVPSELLNFLADDSQPIDVRLAVVNQIGWNIDGKTSGEQLKQCLLMKHKVKTERQLAKKLDAGTLAVYAYAKAMSDYFNVRQARRLAHKAVRKNQSHSYSVAMASALIDAQHYLDANVKKVYPAVNRVNRNKKLKHDMRQQAVDIIMEYINIYK